MRGRGGEGRGGEEGRRGGEIGFFFANFRKKILVWFANCWGYFFFENENVWLLWE